MAVLRFGNGQQAIDRSIVDRSAKRFLRKAANYFSSILAPFGGILRRSFLREETVVILRRNSEFLLKRALKLYAGEAEIQPVNSLFFGD